jgi:hypothetical protein
VIAARPCAPSPHWVAVIGLIVAIECAIGAQPQLAGAARQPARELLCDPGFSRGFAVLAAEGGGREIGVIRAGVAGVAPSWQVAQWHSRFEFTNVVAASASFAVSNAAKWLTLARGSDRGPELTLGVDSRVEYAGGLRRSPSEPWVHLLVQQSIADAPSLTEPVGLWLKFETRLGHAETFRPRGYTPSLHAAQYQVVLTLNSTRRDSTGCGDFLWFVIPVYDDRHEVSPPHIAQDFAVTQGKLIYNPGAAAFATNTVRAAGWTRFDCDLRPWLERALRAAWDKGYLVGSRDAQDYRVAHINIGWEVPGLNRVAMDLRGLSLTSEPAR